MNWPVCQNVACSWRREVSEKNFEVDSNIEWGLLETFIIFYRAFYRFIFQFSFFRNPGMDNAAVYMRL